MRRLILAFAFMVAAHPASAQMMASCIGTDCAGGGGGSADLPDAKYQNGGCSDPIGCATADGGLYLISSHVWDSSPGVLDSPTGELFASPLSVVASRYDSVLNNYGVKTIPGGVACAVSYTAGDAAVNYCTSITGMIADADEGAFCRRTSSPFATCTDNAGTCGSAIAGADDPTPIVVKNTSIYGYPRYAIMMVTGYGGCAGGANTLTVQPFPYNDQISGDGTDTWQVAMMDAIHTSGYYGAYEAQSLLTAIQETEYVPHKNLAAAYNTDLVADCSAWTTAGVAPALVAYDPTKAAWLGSYSAVRGGACRLDNAANGDAIVSPAITIEAGTSYQMRIRMGSSGTGAAPTIGLIDQSGTAITSAMRIITRGYVTDYNPNTVHTMDQNQIGGWATVAFRFDAPVPATPVAQTVRIRVYTGSNGVSPTNQFYTDDWYMWPSLDSSPLAAGALPWKTVIPNGASGSFRLFTDSRGTSFYGNIISSINILKPSVRPDLRLTFIDDSLSLRYIESALDIASRNTYIGFRLGINDGAAFDRSGPISTAREMIGVSDHVRSLGDKPIWFEENPVMGNSTFSGLAARCLDDDGVTALSCAKWVERINRTLIRSGALN